MEIMLSPQTEPHTRSEIKAPFSVPTGLEVRFSVVWRFLSSVFLLWRVHRVRMIQTWNRNIFLEGGVYFAKVPLCRYATKRAVHFFRFWIITIKVSFLIKYILQKGGLKEPCTNSNTFPGAQTCFLQTCCWQIRRACCVNGQTVRCKTRVRA